MATKQSIAPWTTPTINRALSARYADPEYALLWEVANATGGSAHRSIDAIAMSLWPSRGLELIGFEVKSSRSDWQRELKNPAKAEAIAKYCDRWYLVTGHPDIVADGELPPTWGLLTQRGGKLVEVVKAPALTPVPVTRGFLAALLRRSDDRSAWVRRDEVAGEIRDKVAAAVAREHETTERNALRHKKDMEQLQRNIAEFEKASGVKITDYRHGNTGDAVRFVLDGGLRSQRAALSNLRSQATHIVEAITRGLSAPDGEAAFAEVGPAERRQLNDQIVATLGSVGEEPTRMFQYLVAVHRAIEFPDAVRAAGNDPDKLIAEWLQQSRQRLGRHG